MSHAEQDAPPPRHIADRYDHLLQLLSPAKRQSLILRLAHGYYEGWRPSQNEFADHVAVELGALSNEEAAERAHQRRHGHPVSDITPLLIAQHQPHHRRAPTPTTW